MLSHLYAHIARLRRRWYARHPEARRRLARPVISVGNLSVGGRGKTPLVAHLARLLLADGERPAVLSRGYGRRALADGVVVVRDAVRIHADLARAGDEPLMLARALDGVAIMVSPDRYLAGLLAERRFGCSIHLLDDGFQHVTLERDVDLLLVNGRDLDGGRVLPAGRLREPAEAAQVADAVIVADGEPPQAPQVGDRFGVIRTFCARRLLGQPRAIEPWGEPVAAAPAGVRVLAVAGIAQPRRFFDDLAAAGWSVADALAFRDHHPFSARDVERIVDRAQSAGADLVLTTEKDLVRLLPHRPIPIPLAWVPLAVTVEPAEEFRAWLRERISAARNEN